MSVYLSDEFRQYVMQQVWRRWSVGEPDPKIRNITYQVDLIRHSVEISPGYADDHDIKDRVVNVIDGADVHVEIKGVHYNPGFVEALCDFWIVETMMVDADGMCLRLSKRFTDVPDLGKKHQSLF